jgi:electron transport complex protein RnfE
MNFSKHLKVGLISQNPVLVQLLGMCSTLAITTSFFNGLGMGVSVTIILTLSNIFISLLRKIIPNEVRIACYIVVIAGFVTCVDLILKAFVPALSNSLGVFIPLIVVNCIILGRAEAFASKNGVGAAAVDGICQGIGYTIVLIIMCVFRELLGAGTFGAGLLGGGELGAAPGLRVIPDQFGIKILTMPVGGFLTLGALIAAMQWALAKAKNKKKEAK